MYYSFGNIRDLIPAVQIHSFTSLEPPDYLQLMYNKRVFQWKITIATLFLEDKQIVFESPKIPELSSCSNMS